MKRVRLTGHNDRYDSWLPGGVARWERIDSFDDGSQHLAQGILTEREGKVQLCPSY
jgi:hypothetical protein